MTKSPEGRAGITDADADAELGPLLRSTIDAFSDPIFVKDVDHRFLACNQALCSALGRPYDAIVGLTDADLFPREQVEVFWAIDDAVFATGEPHENEEDFTGGSGEVRRIWTRKFALRDASSRIIGVCGLITDVTNLRRREERADRIEAGLQEKVGVIEQQSSLLEQLAVPVIQIWEGILLLPLIGAIDEERAAQILESLLPAIVRARAGIVLMDVTGVAAVDASVAGYLVRAIRAAELLGCRSIVVGVRPEMARTLTELDVDLSRIATRSTLQSGLEEGLRALDYEIRRGAAARRR